MVWQPLKVSIPLNVTRCHTVHYMGQHSKFHGCTLDIKGNHTGKHIDIYARMTTVIHKEYKSHHWKNYILFQQNPNRSLPL